MTSALSAFPPGPSDDSNDARRCRPRPVILVVEDEQLVALDLKYGLEQLGYDSCGIAATADEAIEFVSRKCPDLILMDIRIRGKNDGIDAAMLIRERFNIPIVFLTAHADEQTIDRAKKAYPFGYVLKPIKSGELRSAIELALYRHSTERQLRQRDRWFSTTLHSIADAVIAVDLGGRVMYMNPVAEQLIGVHFSDAKGMPVADVMNIIESSLEGTNLQPLEAVLQRRHAIFVEEARLRNRASGIESHISDSAAPVLDDDQMIGAVMVFRDVTESRVMKRQLEFADRLASLGTMAAATAHELNNPLGVVVMDAGFVNEELKILRGFMGVDQARRLDKSIEAMGEIQSAASRMSRIVADLRTFSRPSEASADSCSVAQCVEWALRTTAAELVNRAKTVVNLGETPLVRIEEARLGQVLVNLLVNAAHAIEAGDVENNLIRVASHTAPDGEIVIEISDTGCGIPAEGLEKIFDPFYTTKPVGLGTGLGLSVCHGILQSVGGRIYVESALGAGTTFRIVLRAADAEISRAEVSDDLPARKAAQPTRILVVDDEPAMRTAIVRVLEDEDHRVLAVADAREALRLLSSGEMFDVIFSDMMMPSMTGMEFYERLLGEFPAIVPRVIFMSGGAVNQKVAAFLKSIPNETIAKPFKIEALRGAVARIHERAAG